MEHFEEKIQKTKEILSKLNAQDLSLKESLALYKVGVEELKAAQAMLERAKAEYEEIKAQDVSDANAESSAES
ncbi:exodeoxyribonuclease VII small subunit [Helicobacter sp. CLO-3]|uniref:exodeoxyribonuclease VII small subunit n=1 Tax=unclassified Helicobacter TaxID=2593540 RepID=UPI000805C2A9|nr:MULTISPECIES: exodeoxyribonuclease VII small subunit [unclassified Helicobacter]OBV28643.1 exodeoxyribonuclease VII small subunit [Helicobacter sp. CLO-3]OHU83089.1 exodeoxyribonuclease VII small subunit [Helicobacter sp. CLO-3]